MSRFFKELEQHGLSPSFRHAATRVLHAWLVSLGLTACGVASNPEYDCDAYFRKVERCGTYATVTRHHCISLFKVGDASCSAAVHDTLACYVATDCNALLDPNTPTCVPEKEHGELVCPVNDGHPESPIGA